jgi:hypothetical protein
MEAPSAATTLSGEKRFPPILIFTPLGAKPREACWLNRLFRKNKEMMRAMT